MTLSRRDMIGGALALPCLAVRAPAARPMTPTDWLQRWLASFNDPLASAYPDFVKANIPGVVPYLEEDLGVREASGGLDLLRSEQTGPGEITAWVRDRNWDRFSKVLLSIGEKGIDDVSFAGAPPPAGFAIRRLSERELVDAVGHKLRVEAQADRFSGSVLVAKGRHVVFRQAYGFQDPENARLVIPATRFCIGSMGKMFTAVNALQLVQAGRLDLTDSIAALLPDYPDTPLARTVTVQQLLTHTGGTGDFFGADYEKHASELHTVPDFLRFFGRRDAFFPAGSRWEYSNFGFILLGAIIERKAGQGWDANLERHVFRVAGMTATSAVANTNDTALPLTGSARTGLRALPYYVGLPAGGGYATIDDLQRFAMALKHGSLLDPERLALLTTAKVQAGNSRWSLGLRIADRNGASCYGHGGSAPGVNADFAIYPDLGYTVIVLCNRGHPHAVNVAEFIGARLPFA